MQLCGARCHDVAVVYLYNVQKCIFKTCKHEDLWIIATWIYS